MARHLKLSLLGLMALTLAGCAGPNSLPEFDAPQTETDIISVTEIGPDLDADSTRYVGNLEGADFYLARDDDDMLCVIQIRDGNWDQAGCAAGLGVGVELRSGTLVEAGTFVFPENLTEGGERTQLSESVNVITFP